MSESTSNVENAPSPTHSETTTKPKTPRRISRRSFLKVSTLAPLAIMPPKSDEVEAEAASESGRSFLKEERFELLGSTVDYLGVSHSPATYEKYRDLFIDRIRNSDVVISEYLFFEPGSRKIKSDVEFLGSGTGSIIFAETIEGLAAQERKPIGSINPENYALNLWSTLILPLLPLVQYEDIMLGKAIKQAVLKHLRERYHFKIKADVKPMTRREFLTKVGLLGLTAILNYNSSLIGSIRTAISAGGISGDKDLTKAWRYDFDDKFLPDVENYRDIRSGQGLRRLCQYFQSQGGKNIVVVNGAAHMYPTMEYAQNEHKTEIDLKKLPFELYDVFGDPSVRLYDYDQQKKEWVKRPEIS